MTIAQASEMLNPLKITIADVTYDDYSEKPKDTILSCTPDVGQKIAEGAVINVVASAGKKKDVSISATFPLPAGVNMDLDLKVYKNGVVTDEATVNPYYIGTYSTTFTGIEGSENIVVTLNGQDYIYGVVSFTDKDFLITQQFPFIAPTPEPTEAPTAEPTQEPTQAPTQEPSSGEGAVG